MHPDREDLDDELLPHVEPVRRVPQHRAQHDVERLEHRAEAEGLTLLVAAAPVVGGVRLRTAARVVGVQAV